MRFLFAWQHVSPEHRVTGPDGLRAVLEQLDGYELAAGAWERHVLPARVQGYSASVLDGLCFAGVVAWGRLSSGSASSRPGPASRPVRSTPVALCLREHLDAWRTIAASVGASPADDATCSADASRILDRLRQRGASFVPELMSALSLTADDVQRALGELVAAGAVTSDGFAGLRAMFVRRQAAVVRTGGAAGGRWSLLGGQGDAGVTREAAVERCARTLLKRYGIVFRRLLTRDVQGVRGARSSACSGVSRPAARSAAAGSCTACRASSSRCPTRSSWPARSDARLRPAPS